MVKRHLPLLFLAALGAAFSAGCGGGGENPVIPPADTLQPGFYRGTVTFADSGSLPTGTVPVIADIQADGTYSVNAYAPPSSFRFDSDGTAGTLVSTGSVLNGTVTDSFTTGTFTFQFSNEGTEIASGNLTKADLPTLGTQTTLPPSGVYQGELLIVSNGRAVAVGRVNEGFVTETGDFTASVGGGGEWTQNGTFAGKLDGSGTLTGGVLLSGGGTISQTVAPQYSYDGTTLIVKYDNLRLENGSAWLILTRPAG
jgi:hypothetical protein